MCFVDIDNRSVDFPEDLPTFPYQTELKNELTQILNKYQNLIGAENISRSYPSTQLKSATTLKGDDAAHTGWANSPKRKEEILQQSEAWKKISNLAKKTGVWESIEDIVLEDTVPSEKGKEIPVPNESDGMSISDVSQLKFNGAIREIFLNCFVHMFASYENFVIVPTQDLESWMSNRETVYNFDKAAFLSDQPAAHLPFLSAFIETQMFTTLMDNKIVSHWEDDAEPELQLFDARIKDLRDAAGGEQRMTVYNPCSTVEESGK